MPGFTQIPNDDVFDDPLWTSEKFTKAQAHCDLYHLAQFQPGIVQKRGVIIELDPGQVGWSQSELAKRWGRSLNWIRNLLKYLERAGHIVVQKTNISSTITLLHWVSNDTTDGIADGSQRVQQKDRRRYTNNIVNTENTVNKENTHKGVGVFDDHLINELWVAYKGNDDQQPTLGEKSILNDALHYKNINFWIPLCDERREIIGGGGGFVPANMKYWFSGGFREMKEKSKKGIDAFRKTSTGYTIAWCSECGDQHLLNDEFQLRAKSTCCSAEFVPEKPINVAPF